ncbi:hypothetical protein ISS22_01795 [candidate division KSB1 bacterium]|nr:hypothetical protein [candidate division KSB1 bacterium]
MAKLTSIEDYEIFLYSLPNNYREIEYSTLVVKRYNRSIAEVSGTIFFKNNIKLSIKELIDFRKGVIKTYSYEVHVGGNKQFWYDSQPHPNDASLQSTHPHHKHIHPDIKHNRIPSKNMNFTRENLSFLIEEIIINFFKPT